LNFSTTPPVPPEIDSISILEVNSRFWYTKGVLNVGLELYAIVEFGVNVGSWYLFLSSKCCLITIPVDKLVLAGTYPFIALNNELSKYLISLK
jgi:hypothetical protein